MSTALAIAAVTAVLKDLLNNGLIDHDLSASVGDVLVTALPPDRIDVSDGNEKTQLNLFLYQVTQNQGWRNSALPSRDASGQRISNPPLALDLHYLLSAYGAKDFHAEILLGYGMQLFHETPVLPRDAIRKSLAPPFPLNGGGLPPPLQALATSELADQLEQIKIAPFSLTTEEISRLWTAFQARYRPTAAYQATVVLIESRHSTRSSLPVRARNLYAVPFHQPAIDRILSQANTAAPVLDQPILAGFNLVIQGSNLRDDDTVVSISGIEVTPDPGLLSDTRVTIPIPAGLLAGVQAVQVVHRFLMGSPPVPHEGVSSNVAAFVLRPRIISILVSSPGVITVGLNPPVGDSQRVVIMLNEFNPPPGRLPRASSFPSEPRTPTSPPGPVSLITIAFTGVDPGTYLARAQVDGAESLLGVDASGLYNSPQITI